MKNKFVYLLSIFLLFSCNNGDLVSFESSFSSEKEAISSDENKQRLNFVVEEWLYNISYIGISYSKTKFIYSEEEFNSYNIEYGFFGEKVFYENTKFNSSYFEDNILLFFNYGHSSSFENPRIKDIFVEDNKLELIYEYETPLMIEQLHLEDLVIVSFSREEIENYLDYDILVTKNEIIIDNDPHTPGNQL